MNEAPDAKNREWPQWAAWLLLAAGLVVVYAHTFAEMWIRWFPAWHYATLGLYDRLVEGESYYTHGPLVPLVSLLIAILLIRHTSIPVKPRRGAGFLVLVVSLLIHLTACLARVNFVSALTLIGVLAGLVLFFWGTAALRRLWFPLAFLAFMVPMPEVTIAQLNFRLKLLAADWGVSIANVIGVIAERSGNTVFLQGDKTLVVANVCNGLRTIVSLLAFGALYAYVCKLQGVWRIGLFAMALPVAVVANALRIVSLIVVADVWSVEIATGWYHDTSGILIYGPAFLMMFGLERLVLAVRKAVGRPATILPLFHGVLRRPGEENQWPQLTRAIRGGAGGLAVVLILLAAGGTWALNRNVPSMWNQRMASQAMPATLDLDGRHWQSRDIEMDERTLTILETRDYLYRRYAAAGATPVDLCVIFSGDNRKGTHPPDICLEGGGREIVEKEDVVLTGVEGRGDVPCRAIVVQSGLHREYFLYVYKCGKDYTPSFWKQQFVIFTNGLLSRNASGALIRVSTAMGEDPVAARRRALMLMGATLPCLDRTLP